MNRDDLPTARSISLDQIPRLAGPPFGSPVRKAARLPSVRAIVVLLIVGVGLLVTFVALVNTASSGSDRLRQHGVREAGTVSRLTADTGSRSGRGWVSYRVGSRVLVGSVDLGSDVTHYQIGQIVTVFYDPHHPSTMTIDQEDNQSALSVDVTIAALVLGVGCTGVGLYAAGLRMVRRWRPAAPTATRRRGRLPLSRHVRVRKRASTVLGWGSWPVLIIGWGGVALTAVFGVLEAHGHGVTAAHAIGDAGGFGAVAAFLFIVGTARVSGSSDGTLHLINAAFEVRIPVEQIQEARADGGLQILAVDGCRYGATAFGNSVLGGFLGYQRAHRVLHRYEDWRTALPASPERAVVLTDASRRLRPALWTAPAWILGYLLIAALITQTSR